MFMVILFTLFSSYLHFFLFAHLIFLEIEELHHNIKTQLVHNKPPKYGREGKEKDEEHFVLTKFMMNLHSDRRKKEDCVNN